MASLSLVQAKQSSILRALRVLYPSRGSAPRANRSTERTSASLISPPLVRLSETFALP